MQIDWWYRLNVNVLLIQFMDLQSRDHAIEPTASQRVKLKLFQLANNS